MRSSTPSSPLPRHLFIVADTRLANVRQAPRPLRCPLIGTLLLAAAWPLIGIREDPVEDPCLRHWVHHRRLAPLLRSSSSPSSPPSRRHMCRSNCGTACSGSPQSRVRGVVRCWAARQRSSSSLSPCLLSRLLYAFFCEESSALIHSEKRRGQLNIHFAKWILPPSQIFTPFDFYKSRLTFRLIQTICENVKIIMIYLKYIL
jgi:hypothetical protein